MQMFVISKQTDTILKYICNVMGRRKEKSYKLCINISEVFLLFSRTVPVLVMVLTLMQIEPRALLLWDNILWYE